MESTPTTFLPLPIHRAIIRRWVRDLEAYRTPKERTFFSAMLLYDNVRNKFVYRATGLYAERCRANSSLFYWQEYERWASADDEWFSDETTFGLRRRNGAELYIETLPHELRWLLGFSEEEEDRVNQWDSEGLPFTEIAARLREIYLREGAEIADEETAWRIGVENFPVYDSSEEYLREVGKMSAWSGEGIAPHTWE